VMFVFSVHHHLWRERDVWLWRMTSISFLLKLHLQMNILHSCFLLLSFSVILRCHRSKKYTTFSNRDSCSLSHFFLACLTFFSHSFYPCLLIPSFFLLMSNCNPYFCSFSCRFRNDVTDTKFQCIIVLLNSCHGNWRKVQKQEVMEWIRPIFTKTMINAQISIIFFWTDFYRNDQNVKQIQSYRRYDYNDWIDKQIVRSLFFCDFHRHRLWLRWRRSSQKCVSISPSTSWTHREGQEGSFDFRRNLWIRKSWTGWPNQRLWVWSFRETWSRKSPLSILVQLYNWKCSRGTKNLVERCQPREKLSFILWWIYSCHPIHFSIKVA
jgi:hypothetical protein